MAIALPDTQLDFEQTVSTLRAQVDERLDQWLPLAPVQDAIASAMREGTLAPGKRIRAFGPPGSQPPEHYGGVRRQHEDQQEPSSLRDAGQIPPPEDVAEDPDEDPEERDPGGRDGDRRPQALTVEHAEHLEHDVDDEVQYVAEHDRLVGIPESAIVAWRAPLRKQAAQRKTARQRRAVLRFTLQLAGLSERAQARMSWPSRGKGWRYFRDGHPLERARKQRG